MDIWIGGEIDEAVEVPLREAQAPVMQLIRSKFARKRYGAAVTSIVIIPIIMADDAAFPEIRKYHKGDKSLELRLRIPVQVFLSAALGTRKGLLLGLVYEAAREAERRSLPGFDTGRFLNDVRAVQEAKAPRQKRSTRASRGGGSSEQ